MGTGSNFMRMSAVAALVLTGAMSASTIAHAGNYGCFVVKADTLNIRERAFASSDVLAVAKKGDILEKRKLWCTWRGFWCAVRKGDIEGYADKSFMEKLSKCP